MQSAGAGPLLLAHRAFVVQFGAATDVEAGCWAGRVEHVVSGQATHFHTLEELLGFIRRVLTGVGAMSTQRVRDPLSKLWEAARTCIILEGRLTCCEKLLPSWLC